MEFTFQQVETNTKQYKKANSRACQKVVSGMKRKDKGQEVECQWYSKA